MHELQGHRPGLKGTPGPARTGRRALVPSSVPAASFPLSVASGLPRLCPTASAGPQGWEVTKQWPGQAGWGHGAPSWETNPARALASHPHPVLSQPRLREVEVCAGVSTGVVSSHAAP